MSLLEEELYKHVSGCLISGFGIDEIDIENKIIKGWYLFDDLIEQHGHIWKGKNQYVIKKDEEFWDIKNENEHFLVPNTEISKEIEDVIRERICNYFSSQEELSKYVEEISKTPIIEKFDYTKDKNVYVLVSDRADKFYRFDNSEIIKDILEKLSIQIEWIEIIHSEGYERTNPGGGCLLGVFTEDDFIPAWKHGIESYTRELHRDDIGLIIIPPEFKERAFEFLYELETNFKSFYDNNGKIEKL